MPLGQKIARRWDVSTSVKTEQIQQKRWRKADRTYKSTASASLWVVALVISRGSVWGPAVLPWWVTGVSVALLRVLHPLPHVLFTSEQWRVRGWRGGRGGGGRRAIPLLFTLPASTNIEDGCEWLKNTVLRQKSSEVQVVAYWVFTMVTGDMTDFFQLFLLHTNKLNLKSEQIKASFITSTFKL